MIALLALLGLVVQSDPAPTRWEDELLCWAYDDELICHPRVVSLGTISW